MQRHTAKKDHPLVLLVEDDNTQAYFLAKNLESFLLTVDIATDAKIALAKMNERNYALALVDIGLPNINGLDLTARIRERDKQLPVIIITAYNNPLNEKLTFNRGANLYHPKPINFDLLRAQIAAVLKLYSTPEKIKVGSYQIEPNMRRIWRDGKEITLSYKEFELVLQLVFAGGNVLTREDILQRTFKGNRESSIGSVDTLVSRTRTSLGEERNSSIIETVHSKGFRLNMKMLNQNPK
jgi:two-component system response regulator ArlR